MNRRNCVSLSLLIAFSMVTVARGQENPNAAAIARGVQYLKGSAKGVGPGEAAWWPSALIKSGVTIDDPALYTYVSQALTRFQGTTYVPSRTGGTEAYEAAVIGMALANLDANLYRPQIEAVARFLLSKPAGQRLLGLRRPHRRRHFDQPVCVARALGG